MHLPNLARAATASQHLGWRGLPAAPHAQRLAIRRVRWLALCAALLMAWIATTASGAPGTSSPADEDVKKHPGYCDFGPLQAIFGEQQADVEVFLERNLLSMVAAVTRNGDPELSDMLAKLKQIRVQTFKIDDRRADAIEEKTAEVARRLEDHGWQTVVRVRQKEKGEQTYIYMKWVEDVVQGLVVMNIDPHAEASFVNIVGEVDPEQLGRLGRKFDIQALDDSLELDLGRHRHDSRKQDSPADKHRDRK